MPISHLIPLTECLLLVFGDQPKVRFVCDGGEDDRLPLPQPPEDPLCDDSAVQRLRVHERLGLEDAVERDLARVVVVVDDGVVVPATKVE